MNREGQDYRPERGLMRYRIGKAHKLGELRGGYYQAGLRWIGQGPPPNTEVLLSAIEERIEVGDPDVQWAMSFTAAQIGILSRSTDEVHCAGRDDGTVPG